MIGAGLTGTAAAGLGLALIVIAALTWWKGEELADRLDVGPAVDVIEHVSPGLTDKEVEEFSVLHQEYLQMKDEKREEMQKEARNKGPNTSHLNKQ